MAAAIVAESAVTARDRFSFTLFLATALHAVLLIGVGFTMPDKQAPQRSLEVTLAQHRSEQAPDKADFLAQANQEGSGDLAEKQEISTTEMADFHDNVIREIQPNEQVSSAKSEQPVSPNTVTTTGRSQFKASKISEEQTPQDKKREEALSLLQRNL